MANSKMTSKSDTSHKAAKGSASVKAQKALIEHRLPLISGLHPHFQKLVLLFLLTLFGHLFGRVEFLVWNWPQFQDKSWGDILFAFVVGFRFDLATSAGVLILPFLLSLVPWGSGRGESLWKWLAGFSFLILQWPLLIFNLVDNEMVNVVGRRFTIDTLFLFREAQGGQLTGFLQTYWKLYSFNIPFCLLFLFVSIWIFRLHLHNPHIQNPKRRMPSLRFGAHSFVFFALLVIFSRGGFQKKPLSFVNANVFAAPLLNNMVLNSSFTIAKSLNKEKLTRAKFFEDQNQMLALLNQNLQESRLAVSEVSEKPNVVIIIVESLALEYMGRTLPSVGTGSRASRTDASASGDGAGAGAGGSASATASVVLPEHNWTPFLNQLADKSLFFENAFANGRRSIEGVAAVVAGIPALMTEPFVSSSFSSNYFVGLATQLGAIGYSTSFFHGGNNGTMYFDTFTKSAGFAKYYGSSEYPNIADHDGAWGIYDDAFLKFMKKELDKEKAPFFSTVFTLSSHQPYRIPDRLAGQFKEGPIEILKSISYADYSLKEFFAEAEKAPWFNNTIFVITGDHAFKHYRPEFQNDMGDYRIPLLIYSPKFKLPENVDTQQFVQQIDIPLSVLDLINQKPKEQVLLGRSVFSRGPKYISNFADGRMLLFDKEAQVSWGYLGATYDSEVKPLGEVEISAEEKAKRLNILKAHVQYFSEGLWDNRLYYPVR